MIYVRLGVYYEMWEKQSQEERDSSLDGDQITVGSQDSSPEPTGPTSQTMPIDK